MRLIQYREAGGARKVGLVTEDGDHVRPVQGAATVYELAEAAAASGGGLAGLVERRATALGRQSLPSPPATRSR